MNEIDQVRRFNRIVTQRNGALEDSFLARGRPLGEARVIHEIGSSGGIDLKGLRARLGLDSGYMSRLLRSLEGQGVIAVTPDPDDSRARLIHLTAKGEAEFAAYDAMSDRQAADLLGTLDPARRARLVAAMGDVERLLQAAALEIALESADSADALWCVRQYVEELNTRFDTGFDPAAGNTVETADMMPPNGSFLVARLDGEAVGCGGLKRLDGTTGEIKRVWAAPAMRGVGVATRIMDELERLACEAGFARVVLDTNGTLTEARAMYGKRGYREIERYNDNPYAQHWFEKRLGGDAAR